MEKTKFLRKAIVIGLFAVLPAILATNENAWGCGSYGDECRINGNGKGKCCRGYKCYIMESYSAGECGFPPKK